jgi:dihydrofolate reductase
MRTLAVTQNITMDGSIEMLGDWFSPQGQADDRSSLLDEMHRQDAASDAFLVGRRTFVDMRGYWPTAEDDRTGIAEYLNAVSKYVVSSTLTDPEWQNTTILSGDAMTEIANLKAAPGEDIVVTGSITLTHALIEAGLVDEFRLFVYPVVQGRGRRLFPDGFEVPHLELLEARDLGGGIAFTRHALPRA